MAINPLRLDPTRTTLLRNAFVVDMTRRMARIRRAVIQLVVTEDVFGLDRKDNYTTPQSTAIHYAMNAGGGNPNHDPKTGEFTSDGLSVPSNHEIVHHNPNFKLEHDEILVAHITKAEHTQSIIHEGLKVGTTSRQLWFWKTPQDTFSDEKAYGNTVVVGAVKKGTVGGVPGGADYSEKGILPSKISFIARRNKIIKNAVPIRNTRWQFATDDKKIEAYQTWLKGQVDQNLLTVDPAHHDTPWLQPYIGKAYKKGVERAYNDTSPEGEDLSFVEGGKAAFMKMSFEGPVMQSKLRTLSTRAFTNLKGISADMDKQMTMILAQGLAKGTGAKALGKQLADSVDGLSKGRAATIARTEIVHAHNEGQLDSFEAMNQEGVGVMAEWSTAHDGKVCPLCAPMEGVILTIKEARGMLPRHPNCRCAFLPADVGENEKGTEGTTETTWAGPEQGLEEPGTEPTGQTTGQVWDKEDIGARIRASLFAERPNLDVEAARKASRWAGADVGITGKLKPGSKAWEDFKAAEKAAISVEATMATKAAKKKAAEAALAKEVIPTYALPPSPEITFDELEAGKNELPIEKGMHQVFTSNIDGNEYLVKRTGTTDAIKEEAAKGIANLLQIGEWVPGCRVVKDGNGSTWLMSKYIPGGIRSAHLNKGKVLALSDEDKGKMILYDYLLANYDRHGFNFGFTRDGRLVLIDHENAFGLEKTLPSHGLIEMMGGEDKNKGFVLPKTFVEFIIKNEQKILDTVKELNAGRDGIVARVARLKVELEKNGKVTIGDLL